LLIVAETELEKLSRDPKKLGRKTVSPPFPPTIEHIFHFRLRDETEELHYITVFFLYVDDHKELYITAITISPPFLENSEKISKAI